jgi:hypothetical protein
MLRISARAQISRLSALVRPQISRPLSVRSGAASVGTCSKRFASNSKKDDDLDSLFAQALAAQKLREQQQSGEKASSKDAEGDAGSSSKEDQEAERIKRVLDAADKEANANLLSQAKFTSFAVLLGVLSTYMYLGYSSEVEAVEGDDWFITHNKRVWASLVDSVNVSSTNHSTG